MKENAMVTFSTALLRNFCSISVCALLLSTSVFAQTTATPTYPDINTFLWGNTSVNAPGQTSMVTGTGFTYRFLLPQVTNPSQKFPVVIYLHGEGENGTDGVLPLQASGSTADGALAMVSTANPNNQSSFPCFFVVPQLPVGQVWSSDSAGTEITNLIKTLEAQYGSTVDPNRIYLTGQSGGGTACYDLPLIMSQSNHFQFNPFACTVPVSASFSSSLPLVSQPFMPVWAFHAADDAVAPIGSSDDTVVPALRNFGSVVYSRYQTGGHAIGEVAYQHPELLPWMFGQNLGKPGPLSNFVITNKTVLNGGSYVTLSGTAGAGEGFTSITWTDDANSGSGAAQTSLNANWTAFEIPMGNGTNHLQVTATAPNNTASVSGTITNFGGNLTVNIPFTVSPAGDLALAALTTVSSIDSTADAGAYAVDGNTTTRWSSSYSDPQWIEVDLRANYDIYQVNLDWETACGSDYLIQISTDNVNWTTLSTVTGNTTTGNHTYSFAGSGAPTAPSGRYVRVYGTARATQWGYSLWEFDVYGQNSVATPQASLMNLAMNKPTTTSSVQAPSVAGQYAVDGIQSTRWSSLYTDNEWIEVDLGADYNISEIDLNWQLACGANYQIQTSVDGVTWTTQNNVVGNTTAGVIQYPYVTAISGRYVRMLGTLRATQYGYSLWEFTILGDGTTAVLPPPPPPTNVTNVALNKPVTVSSTENSTNVGSNAVDGNVNTRWSSAYTDNEWIEVDLGANYDIDEIDLNWETACGYNYIVETSTNGVTWKQQNLVMGNTTTGVIPYTYATPISARYVRMLGEQRATQWGYSLWEITVLSSGLTGGTPPPAPTNLALNMPVTVSSTDYPSNGGSNAVDGNINTRWSSAYSDNQWIVVDLGASHSINEIDLNWQEPGYAYLVQTSTDDVNWTTQNNVIGNTSTGVIPYTYSTPVTARYVRMYGTQRATQWGYSLWEMSVIGQ